MTETENKIYDLIVSEMLNGDGEGLEENTHLFDLNILDSFKIMMMLAFIEEKLGVMITPEEMNKNNFSTISSIAAIVDSKLE